MSASFLTFQTFTNPDVAAEMAEQLQAHGIDFRIENDRTYFDPSYANNSFEANINLKLQPADFVKARSVLEAYYAKEVDNIDKDYHLFSFSNAELTDIIVRPDEWGVLDYQLAQKILRERGMTIDSATLEQVTAKRNDKLAQPETANSYWIYAGYILAILGGILGVMIACTLIYPKKTLPDGRSMPVYREEDRNNGTRILLISCISTLFWIAFRWWFVKY